MKLRSKKGFTLIELIIVIAILGIIALIAVPNLAGIRQRSQVSADKRTAEQIGKAVRIWATDVDAGVRNIPTTVVKYDSAEADTDPLYNLCDTYISKGYQAKSLSAGPGDYYVSSTGTGDNNANQKILIGIANDSSATENMKKAALTGTTVDYDGSKAAWAYLEK